MRLIVHPHSRAEGVEALEANIARSGTALALQYVLTGGIGGIVVPPPIRPRRTDDLWRITCFEAFVRGEGERYAELNLSPSGAWAAYQFDSPRAGMRPLELTEEPEIIVEHLADRLIVSASLRLAVRFDSPGAPLGLAAVIEGKGGAKSYWALVHGEGPPDFHNPDCFVAQLP